MTEKEYRERLEQINQLPRHLRSHARLELSYEADQLTNQ